MAKFTDDSFQGGNLNPVVGIMISSGVALAGSLLALVSAVYLARRTSRANQEIETLKVKLARDSAELDARRSYESEARKRVYKECEPVILKLADSADYAAERIISLGDARRWPEFAAQRDTTKYWMLAKSSEIISFSHALVTPLALYNLLKESVTVVDLSFDTRLARIYALAGAAYEVHLNDYKISAIEPALPYDPVTAGWRQKRLEEPEKYWWQGLTKGRLDSAVELAIHRDAQRVTSFSEYESRYLDIFADPTDARAKSLGLFCNPMYNFVPTDRPVFWRMLLIQLLIYRKLSDVIRLNMRVPVAEGFEFKPQDVAELQVTTTLTDETFEAALGAALKYTDRLAGTAT